MAVRLIIARLSGEVFEVSYTVNVGHLRAKRESGQDVRDGRVAVFVSEFRAEFWFSPTRRAVIPAYRLSLVRMSFN